ncbi:WRKY domain [Dillenia turbinata]|uniref:WRKY domain n=1 Tax=Dillenia turbinata TaxID=194707 RepID=A0AAN8UFD1_9MAGN
MQVHQKSKEIRPSGISSLDCETPVAKTSCECKGEKNKKMMMRSHRYAFQTRSQVDILDDGYRWRKYGQKAVKNNKFPRSYYRCAHKGCKVKKQIQRLSKDEGIVVTTYEGMHAHPVEKPPDNFDNILNHMRVYTPF